MYWFIIQFFTYFIGTCNFYLNLNLEDFQNIKIKYFLFVFQYQAIFNFVILMISLLKEIFEAKK